jgi:hypothetical protein
MVVWDNMQFASFKWIHYEINTLISYYDEIAFENSLMLNQTGNNENIDYHHPLV